MKMMKRIFCLFLSLALAISLLTGCGGSSSKDETSKKETSEKSTKENKDTTTKSDKSEDDTTKSAKKDSQDSDLPEMTDEKITLTYLHFDNEVLCNYLADEFMALYPNIKVEATYVGTDNYNETLLNLVSSGQTPDCFMILYDCGFALENELLGDMTEYWENDPENDNLLPTINEAKYGYYGTDKKWATPMKFFPSAVYADMTVFEQLNLDMVDPDDWTWETWMQSIKDATNTDQGIYGLNTYYTPITFYPIAANSKCVGEFGWNGKEFDLTDWATGLNEYADLINGKYHAPYFDTDEAEAWLGDRTLWAGFSGKIAYQSDAFWTYLNLFDTDEYQNKGINFVPYVMPSKEGVDGNTFGILDMGGISSATEHPREAYELLKFMGWGVDGWKSKVEAYKNEKNADGTELYRASMPLPITLDKDIWSDMREFFPDDEERAPYWDAFFEKCTRPVPYGATTIPGFSSFIDQAYAGIEDQVIQEGKDAADFVDELNTKANEFNKQAMEQYFE